MNSARTEGHFDVIIVGAGPAGAACALALKETNLRIALFDKAVFPRDKICGDAIPSNALRVLKQIDEKLSLAFENNFEEKNKISGSRLIAPSGKFFDLSFVNSGHAATRTDFDNFLFKLTKKHVENLTVFENNEIKKISAGDEKVSVEASAGNFSASVIVGCDGAHSVVAKQLTNFKVDKNFYLGAVRAYYKNIGETKEDLLEIHFLKNYMPGYFWIFPLSNGLCNVGFGMASNQIAKRKIDLRNSLTEIIKKEPQFKNRFSGAVKVDKTVGFGLPCGGRKLKVSGNRFLLCGDAASLINPATGEGIGNAMISGRLAALQINNSFANNDFTERFMKDYDTQLYKKLYKDLRIQHVLQRVAGNREWLVNFALNQVAKHEFIRERVRKFF